MRELVDSCKALTGTPNAEPGLLAFLFGSYNSQLTTYVESRVIGAFLSPCRGGHSPARTNSGSGGLL